MQKTKTKKHNLQIFLYQNFLIHVRLVDSTPDFEGVETAEPNCVVLGDAGDELSYANLNTAFQCLMAMKTPVLFSLGKG